MRIGRLLAGAIVAVTAAGAASACGPAPWAEDATPSPLPTVAPTPAPTEEPVRSDLSSGSANRTLTAGAVEVDVTYWSELAMDRWTAPAAKPLSLSLSTTITPDDGQGVYLQRASMIVVPDGGEASAPQEDVSTEDPGYLVLDPYSYSQTFTLGALPEGTRSVTVQMRYEFLVQTTPTSDEFAKQTATDSLTIAVAS